MYFSTTSVVFITRRHPGNMQGMHFTMFCYDGVAKFNLILGLCSLSGRATYHKITSSLEAKRLEVIMIVSLWNLTGISAAALPWCQSSFRAIGEVWTRISWLRYFVRYYGQASVLLVNIGLDIMIDGYFISNTHHNIYTSIGCAIFFFFFVAIRSFYNGATFFLFLFQ